MLRTGMRFVISALAVSASVAALAITGQVAGLSAWGAYSQDVIRTIFALCVYTSLWWLFVSGWEMIESAFEINGMDAGVVSLITFIIGVAAIQAPQKPRFEGVDSAFIGFGAVFIILALIHNPFICRVARNTAQRLGVISQRGES